MTFGVVAKTFYSSVAVCQHRHRLRRRRIVDFVELSNVIQSGHIRSADEQRVKRRTNQNSIQVEYKVDIFYSKVEKIVSVEPTRI